MEKFMKWMEEKAAPKMSIVAQQRYLRAIRDGIVAILPLVIVGSFFVLIANPPIKSLQTLVAPYTAKILIPQRLTMGLMALFASFTMGYYLSLSFDEDGITGGILSMVAFLLTSLPVNVDSLLPQGQGIGWTLPLGDLGGKGLFVAILSMIFAVNVYRYFRKKEIIIRMPEQVPPAVARSFEALLPAAFIIVTIWVLRVLLNFNIHAFMLKLFSPIAKVAGNTILGVIIPKFFITFLWACGIHGGSIVNAAIRPIWFVLLDANVEASLAGMIPPNIVIEPFFMWFMQIGGAGMTLSLCFLMLRSKSEYLRKLGKISLIPGLFNINEPILFGLPIVMNPLLVIPFVLSPIVSGIIAYIAMSLNLVQRFTIIPPWTLPAPIGAYLSSNGDIKAAILSVICILVSFVIYYPFFKTYEQQLLKEESGEALNK